MKMKLIGLFLLATLEVTCTSNPLTGKKQLTMLPEKELQQMSDVEYRSFLTKSKIIAPAQNKAAKVVKQVGDNIIRAVKKYYSQKGISAQLNGYTWEVNLVDDNTVNAWCMPGGKIVVYTGLLSITQNEAALAVVMGHEVSHALLQHGNQRMSQGMLQQLGGIAIAAALTDKPKETKDIFLNAYGVGSQVGVMLPFSRKNELEADKYGLIFSALAGYNPEEAIALWERMDKASTGNRPVEFLSTHPSEGKRIEKLRKYMPEALKYYQNSK
ncbi:MAG: M48 family metallopeptidase [Chitinophagaceae bacterium]